jgi:hypothetical protein
VELQTATRSESIKIHRKLLESKCNTSVAALRHDFKGRAMRMTSAETRYEIVAQSVEWAYRGDYSEVVTLPADSPGETKSEDSSSLEGGVKMSVDDFSKARTPSQITLASSPDGSLSHTLLCHLHVYIKVTST